MALVLVLGLLYFPQVMACEYDSQSDEAKYSLEKLDTSPFVELFFESSVEATQEYPFSFNVNSVDGNLATISFSSKSEVQSLFLEQIGSKNVITHDNCQYTF